MQFVFAGHTLDTDRRELRRGRDTIAVEPQLFDVLVYLVQNRERLVSKDDPSPRSGATGLSPTRH